MNKGILLLDCKKSDDEINIVGCVGGKISVTGLSDDREVSLLSAHLLHFSNLLAVSGHLDGS